MAELEDCISISQSTKRIQCVLHAISRSSRTTKNTSVVLLLLIHLVLSLWLKDFTWLASSGALLSILGVLVIFTESFFLNLDHDIKNVYLEGEPEELKTHGNFWGEYVAPEDVQNKLNIRRTEFITKYHNISYYLIVTVLGTLLWAYAGFLNKLIFPSC